MKKALWVCYFCIVVFIAVNAAGIREHRSFAEVKAEQMSLLEG